MNQHYQFRTFPGQRQVQLGGWRAILAMSVAAALGVALLLTVGLFLLFLVPVFLAVGFVARWWLRREIRKQQARRPSPQQQQRSGPLGAIEGQYEVIGVERTGAAPGAPGGVGRGWGPR